MPKREKITWVGFKKSELKEIKDILDCVTLRITPSTGMGTRAMMLSIRIGSTLEKWDK